MRFGSPPRAAGSAQGRDRRILGRARLGVGALLALSGCALDPPNLNVGAVGGSAGDLGGSANTSDAPQDGGAGGSQDVQGAGASGRAEPSSDDTSAASPEDDDAAADDSAGGGASGAGTGGPPLSAAGDGTAPAEPEADCATAQGSGIDAVGCTDFYLDADGDGYGDESQDPACACGPFELYQANQGGDCDDRDDSVHSGADESCNGVDDNCNGTVDDPWAATLGKACDGPDADSCEDGVQVCSAPGDGTECNDELTTLSGSEVCDGADNDCDGQVDEDWSNLGQPCDGNDADRCEDGVWQCDAQGTGSECSDDPTSKEELCDGLDNDCDGDIDEDWPTLGDACDGPDDADICQDGVLTCDGVGAYCDDAITSPKALTVCEPLVSVSTTFGADTGTYDPNTGLTWLDPTLSTGMTYAEAVAATASGGQFSGYRVASKDELYAFLGNAGVQPDTDYLESNFAPAMALLALTGITGEGRANRDNVHFMDHTTGWILPVVDTGQDWAGGLIADPYYYHDASASVGSSPAGSTSDTWGVWYVR